MFEGALYQKALKPGFKSRDGAMRALVLATQIHDVKRFRSTMLSCTDPSYDIINPQYNVSSTSNLRKSIRRELEKSLRDDTQEQSIQTYAAILPVVPLHCGTAAQ